MNERVTSQPVIFELVGPHVAMITLNRPAQRNAVNGAMATALETAVERVESDQAIRVAVLYSSSERAFCAGADLSEVAGGRGHTLSTEKGGFAGFVYAERSKPWIAAVRGFALGGGLELSLGCDLTVAGTSASFGLPEVRRGVIAGAGGAYRLARAIPRSIALEMLATGMPISAQRGYELGLVNRVVADDEVRTAALALADSIAANAPHSVRESLLIGRRITDHTEAELRVLLQAAADRVMASPNAIEGSKAFFEKRSPVWQD